MVVTLHLSENTSEGCESAVLNLTNPPLLAFLFFHCFVSQHGNKEEGEKVHKILSEALKYH